MRVISGKFKGRKLVSFDQDHIRPTTDRVKESLFNILAPFIENSLVLDLYSGTGNLGIESLSRGAAHVTFVESNIKSIKIIDKNIELLKIADGIDVVKNDVLNFLREFEGDPFDIILIDPPFPSLICLKTLELVAKSKVAGSDTRIAIEHSKREILPEKIGRLTCIDTRNYGDKLLAFFSKEP